MCKRNGAFDTSVFIGGHIRLDLTCIGSMSLMQNLKMQQSADSADMSGTSSGTDAESSSGGLKAIWKKAINKLRRSRSTDEKSSSSTNTAAGNFVVIVPPLRITSILLLCPVLSVCVPLNSPFCSLLLR